MKFWPEVKIQIGTDAPIDEDVIKEYFTQAYENLKRSRIIYG